MKNLFIFISQISNQEKLKTPKMELLECIENANNSCTTFTQRIADSIENLRNKVPKQQSALDLPYTEALKELQQSVSKWIESSESFLSALDTIGSTLTPKITWHPPDLDAIEMFYHSGDSPWSFWLTYNMTSGAEDITKIIESNQKNGKLEKLEELYVGTFVICCGNKLMFRGLIVAILDKSFVRVLNIDKCVYKVIKKEFCYEVTNDLCRHHANVIQCCLTKEEFDENMWSEDLTALFQNTLRDSRLTARVIETNDTCPPNFLVELYAFNASYQIQSNISYWFLNELLPAIKALKNVEKDQLYINIDEEILDPFSGSPDDSIDPPASLAINGHRENSNGIVDILSSNLKSSILINDQIIQNDDLANDKSQNRLPHLISETDPTSPNKIKKEPFKFESVLDAPEFSPYPEYDNNCVKSEVQSLSTGLENIIISSECEANLIPETCITSLESGKVCSFFSTKGYCWNPGCQKEHNISSDNNWSGDLPPIFTESLNSLALPEVGLELSVTVTHITSPSSFYCNLPSCYSAVDEDEPEILESLIAQLNGPESLKELHVLSALVTLGQLIVAHSKVKNMWLRASVYDIYDDNTIQAFFVDFGNVEQVSLNHCREILPQYIHLPFQAVYCTLSKLQLKKNKEEVGKSYLSALIREQEITIRVVERYKVDTSLEVIAHTNSGLSLNKVLVDKGYCSYRTS